MNAYWTQTLIHSNVDSSVIVPIWVVVASLVAIAVATAVAVYFIKKS